MVCVFSRDRCCLLSLLRVYLVESNFLLGLIGPLYRAHSLHNFRVLSRIIWIIIGWRHIIFHFTDCVHLLRIMIILLIIYGKLLLKILLKLLVHSLTLCLLLRDVYDLIVSWVCSLVIHMQCILFLIQLTVLSQNLPLELILETLVHLSVLVILNSELPRRIFLDSFKRLYTTLNLLILLI